MYQFLYIKHYLILLILISLITGCHKTEVQEDNNEEYFIYIGLSPYTGYISVYYVGEYYPVGYDLTVLIYEKNRVSVLYEEEDIQIDHLYIEIEPLDYNIEKGVVRFDVILNNEIHSEYVFYR